MYEQNENQLLLTLPLLANAMRQRILSFVNSCTMHPTRGGGRLLARGLYYDHSTHDIGTDAAAKVFDSRILVQEGLIITTRV